MALYKCCIIIIIIIIPAAVDLHTLMRWWTWIFLLLFIFSLILFVSTACRAQPREIAASFHAPHYFSILHLTKAGATQPVHPVQPAITFQRLLPTSDRF